MNKPRNRRLTSRQREARKEFWITACVAPFVVLGAAAMFACLVFSIHGKAIMGL